MGDLPPGFRFYPTEEELVSFYLCKKLQGGKLQQLSLVIPDIDFYELEPWHLPKLSGELCRGDTEQWFFFSPRQEREARGGRPNRTTDSGYWKATGSPSYVYSSDNRVIGVKKTMVFYKGRAPAGRKTKWKMHEYRAIEPELNCNTTVPKLRHEFSLCRVYVISGSFRAFDRRPLGTEARGGMRPDDGPAAALSSHDQGTPSTEKTSSSPESSYSGGRGGEGEGDVDRPGSSSAPTTCNMLNDVQLPWDWEQLNWL